MAKLKLHNIFINEQRTSIRLEALFWETLKAIAKQNHITLTKLCKEVKAMHEEGTYTSSLRTFILAYTIHQDLNEALQYIKKTEKERS